MAEVSSGGRHRSSSFSKAQHLVGQLDQDGLATLEIDASVRNAAGNGGLPGDPPRSMKAALDTVVKGSDSDTASTASEEDYDKMKPDPQTVVLGGKGGGFTEDGIEDSPVVKEKFYEAINTTPKAVKAKRPGLPARLHSIPITLKKSDQKGKYYLIADNNELKNILKMGADRVGQYYSSRLCRVFGHLLHMLSEHLVNFGMICPDYC